MSTRFVVTREGGPLSLFRHGLRGLSAVSGPTVWRIEPNNQHVFFFSCRDLKLHHLEPEPCRVYPTHAGEVRRCERRARSRAWCATTSSRWNRAGTWSVMSSRAPSRPLPAASRGWRLASPRGAAVGSRAARCGWAGIGGPLGLGPLRHLAVVTGRLPPRGFLQCPLRCVGVFGASGDHVDGLCSWQWTSCSRRWVVSSQQSLTLTVEIRSLSSLSMPPRVGTASAGAGSGDTRLP